MESDSDDTSQVRDASPYLRVGGRGSSRSVQVAFTMVPSQKFVRVAATTICIGLGALAGVTGWGWLIVPVVVVALGEALLEDRFPVRGGTDEAPSAHE